MKYDFKYQTTALDIWQLSMYRIYGSIVGSVNIIFTVAMILLSFQFWRDVNLAIKIGLILAVCLFTLIQPVVIYLRAKKQVGTAPRVVDIEFNDKAIHVKSNNQTSTLKWQSIKGILKKPTMLVVLSTGQEGFILTNKVLGKQKVPFYNYVMSNIENK